MMSCRGEKNLITLILPAVLHAHREMHRISFCLISQVLHLIIISLTSFFRIYICAKRCRFLCELGCKIACVNHFTVYESKNLEFIDR